MEIVVVIAARFSGTFSQMKQKKPFVIGDPGSHYLTVREKWVIGTRDIKKHY